LLSSDTGESPVHSPKVVRKDKPVDQSKKDGNYTFYYEEGNKGTEGTSPLQQNDPGIQ
jgi:hypothetical protein